MSSPIILHSVAGLTDFLSWTALAALTISATVVFFVKAVYNTYFHPLSCFPGPFWASVTSFYLTYLFATKKSHLKTKRLHEKYGPVLRLGPNLLSFSDPAVLPKVYHRRADKTPFYSTGLAGEVAPLLQIQPHDAHSARHKALGMTYSMKNLKLLEPEVDVRISMTMDTFRTRFLGCKSELDLSEYTRWYVYDTITQLIYGEPVGLVEQGRDVKRLIESWHDMFFLGGLVATLPWLVHPLITHWPLKNYIMPHKGLNYGSGAIMKSHEGFFQRRLAQPNLAHPGNVFDSFCSANDEQGRPLSRADAERECFLFTVASQDTTAAFISPLISFIATHKDVYNRLMTEIRQFELKGKLSSPVARYDEVAAMPYMQACIRETLRIRPPTPIILPRYAPEGGMMLEGRFVPEGTEIGANPWVIHRNADIFGPDVDTFRPERWLEDETRVQRMIRYDFTWGYGSRRCVGRNVALMDGSKFVLQLFREFQVVPVDTETPWTSENWGINIYFNQKVRLRHRLG